MILAGGPVAVGLDLLLGIVDQIAGALPSFTVTSKYTLLECEAEVEVMAGVVVAPAAGAPPIAPPPIAPVPPVVVECAG